MKSLKELINERKRARKKGELNQQIAECIAPICLDVLKLYFPEHQRFIFWGMNLQDVYDRIPRVSEVKSYDSLGGVSCRDIHQQDVKMALDYLVQKKIIRGFKGGYSMERCSSEIIVESNADASYL